MFVLLCDQPVFLREVEKPKIAFPPRNTMDNLADYVCVCVFWFVTEMIKGKRTYLEKKGSKLEKLRWLVSHFHCGFL